MTDDEHSYTFKAGEETERQRIIELLEKEIEKQCIIEMYNYTAKKVLNELKRASQ